MTRTDQQRKSIEVYCRHLAEALNKAGYYQKALLEKKAIEVPNTQESIKQHVIKAIMQAYCYDEEGNPKTSTTQLETTEVNKIYDIANRFFAENFDMPHIPFPSDEEQRLESFKT